MRSTLWHLGRLFVAAMMGLALCAGAMAQTAKKPNILIIWGDDIGQFNISAPPSSPGNRRCALA
jgi:hypothetical protein